MKLWDFRLDSFGPSEVADDVLRICGSTSIYFTAAIVEFSEVQFMSVSTQFHHAHFRRATPEEIAASRRVAEFDCDLFAIDADAAPRPFFIAAASVEVTLAEP